MQEKRAFRARHPPILEFSTHYQQVGMSQSATPATPNDMITCLETFEKDRFSSFPHRHGDATGNPATRDKTHRNIKTSISYETFSNFHTWQHDKRTKSASPVNTARPQENQRLETRQVGAAKRAFCGRHPPIFPLRGFKIDVFLRVFVGTSKFCYLKIDVSCEASVNFQHIA